MTSLVRQNGHVPRYLLVEEENPFKEDLINLLESCDASVFTANNKAEALWLLKNEKIDVIIVAALSPSGQIEDLLQEVRRGAETKDMPLVLISNYYHSPLYDEMAQQFTKAKYLVRPFQQGEFLQTLKEF